MQFSSDYPFTSRAASYGDGCFTTVLVENGRPELLPEHINRLKLACRQLEIETSDRDWAKLQDLMLKRAQDLNSGILKIIISAGNGGRGYLRQPNAEAQCYLLTLPPVNHYEQWRKQGIYLGVSATKLTLHSHLARIKHLNRLEQVLIKQHKSAFEEDVILDQQDMMVEVSAGNLFWRALGRWFTPEISLSGVEGVMRNHIIKQLGNNQIPVQTVRMGVSALRSATDVFICNSLMKIVPVNCVCLSDKVTLQFKNENLSRVLSVVFAEKHGPETSQVSVLKESL